MSGATRRKAPADKEAVTTEADNKKGHKHLRALGAAVVIFVVCAVAVNLANFVLYPYGSKSQIVWAEYRVAQNVDAVCLGSSLTERAFDPAVIDEKLGCSSFNMGTPLQAPRESYVGMRQAIKDHKVKRVFYGVDFWTLWTDIPLYPGRVFLYEKARGENPAQVLDDLSYALVGSNWLRTPKSINWLFPFTEQRVTLDLVDENVRMQLDGTTIIQATEANEPGWKYYGQGYGNHSDVYDYNSDLHKTFKWLGIEPLRKANLDALAEFCDYCVQNGVELVVFTPPLTDVNFIISRDFYASYSEQIGQIVRDHGGTYIDMNLAVPELYAPNEEYFSDMEHCNVVGARVFSESLASVVARMEAGEDISGLFMSYDEKLATMDHIACVVFDAKVHGDKVKMHAEAFAGSDVKVEYQFTAALVGPDAPERASETNSSLPDDAYKVVQDWSTSPDCEFKPDKGGLYNVRVNVRQVGTDVAWEKHSQCDVVI